MSAKRVYLALLLLGACCLALPAWTVPVIVALAGTFAGVVTLFVAPGMTLLSLKRRDFGVSRIDLVWVAVSGPVLLAITGLVAWLAGDVISPVLLCRAAAIAIVVAGIVVTWREPGDLRLSSPEAKALLVFLLLGLLAAGRSIHSLAMTGELYRDTVTRTLGTDDRSDTRAPYLIPMNVANRWQPFGPESAALYAPWTFTSRGPVVGLAATPAVLIWARTPMSGIAQMARPFEPIDPYGYMQYRFSIIVLSALSAIAFFAALGGGELALIGTAIYALSPFLVHEVYFTWTKQATVPLLLSGFSVAMAGYPAAAGLLVGLAYLVHPSALFTALAFVPLLVAIERGAAVTIRTRALLDLRRWWQSRGAIAAFVVSAGCVMVPWVIYGLDKPDQPVSFLSYVYRAGGHPAATAGAWILSRLQSLASTLAPLYSFVNFRDHPSLLPVFEPPLDGVTFFTQYYYTLPAGVAFVWFCSHFRHLIRALRQARGQEALMLALPVSAFWIQWGFTETGMLREGLHAPFAFLMLAWLRAIPLPALTRPAVNWARAAELILFLWFPVFISNQRLTSQTLMLTDLLGLALTIAATVLLVGFIRGQEPNAARIAPDPGES